MINKHTPCLFLLFSTLVLSSCGGFASSAEASNGNSKADSSSASSLPVSLDSEGIPAYVPSSSVKTREDRVCSEEAIAPANITTEERMKDAADSLVHLEGLSYVMKGKDFTLTFALDSALNYMVKFLSGTTLFASIKTPAKLYIKGEGQLSAAYRTIDRVRYGLRAKADLTAGNGTVFEVVDRYYYPEANVENTINVQRQVLVKTAVGEVNYETIFGIDSTSSNLEWFVPNEVYGSFPDTTSIAYRVYRETLTGLPLAMYRDTTSGYAVSLARYQPIIDQKSNSFACVGIYKGSNSSGEAASSVEVNYPTRDTARRYFSSVGYPEIVYDLSLIGGHYEGYDDAMVDVYTKQFTLQNQRIVNCDIDDVYRLINLDFEKFMLKTTRNGFTSYGLPWRVTIENGLIGPKSYQSGFVGQQLPCAYNMMVYGIKYNDQTSLNNGMAILNFWINSAHMMTAAGVPMIWFNGDDNTWMGYPTFLRMAIDSMEAVLDAYRLAQKYALACNGWLAAVTACANWLVSAQNSDGSWYRCFNYQGTYYKGTESDISWNPGDIARSTSKNNSTMPVRFLGKMYEMTGESKYLNAVTKAGSYIYGTLYPKHVYYGGTCDNPDSIDKEAGVYAMYAYDTLYTLTHESKWLACLEQAAIFTMSSVLTVSFKIAATASSLKAATALKYGYSDGLSYICIGGTSLDNYAAFFYYELFRLYVYSGKSVYLDMAEFIQQNTKSTMDYDQKLNYPYPSLTPEATTIYSFGFSSAEDDDGVMGVWLPWQSAANAEPIAKMYEVFGQADVGDFRSRDLAGLQSTLSSFGVGGHAHNAIQ